MECGRWLLGIDIQPHQLIAVALVRRRDGDQLRGWWHFPLRGEATPTRFPADLPQALSALRARLPRRLSVRTAFPVEQAICHTLPGTPPALTPLQQQTWLWAQSERRLMLPASELACDFTRVADSTGSWQVCAIRRTQRDAWCALFAQAGLVLRRLTLLPCALRTLARLVGEAPTVPLIHGDGQRFCWIAPWGQPLQYGCIPCEAGLAAASAAWEAAAPSGEESPRPYCVVTDVVRPAGIPFRYYAIARRRYRVNRRSVVSRWGSR
ncbi:pilus assembly protein PilM [Edwardsiella tarda]